MWGASRLLVHRCLESIGRENIVQSVNSAYDVSTDIGDKATGGKGIEAHPSVGLVISLPPLSPVDTRGSPG